jgi:hypothetical protein
MKKKLALSKVTVATLTQGNMVNAKGGDNGGASLPNCFPSDVCSIPEYTYCMFEPTYPITVCPGGPLLKTDPEICYTDDVRRCVLPR